MSNVIHIQGVCKGFGSLKVVDDLNLVVPPGSVYAFLGQNGAGKSTTIKMLLGLLKPDVGQVEVLGMNPVTRTAELLDRVGFVSEDRPFYDWMSVAQVLNFSAGFHREWDRALTDSLLGKLSLNPDRKVSALSRGERGKLALVAAMGHRPELLVLDEPTSGLDPVVRREFLEQMLEVLVVEGKTVFFSTHHIDDVERIADRVGVLNGGRLILDGTVDDVKAQFCKVRAVMHDPVEVASLPWKPLRVDHLGQEVTMIFQAPGEVVVEFFSQRGARHIAVEALNLEDIFVARTTVETTSLAA